jgi:hypothetical protein
MTKKREKQLQAIAVRSDARQQREAFDPEGRFATLSDRQFLGFMDYIAAVVYDMAIAIGFYDSRSQMDSDIQDRWS